MHAIKVAVLRGGPSSEYEVSLQTGANILRSLREHHSDTYQTSDVLIDREGDWFLSGMPISIGDACTRFDVVFNALHGSYGEDGKIQHIFESHQVPFTGSGALASAVSMNKMLAKKSFDHHGIKTPFARVIAPEDVTDHTMNALVSELFHTLILPVFVKPVSGGSSVATSLVRAYDQLPAALSLAAPHGMIMLEECIPGIEATCGVIENFRDQELYALPPIEIRPHAGFFDYEAKYRGKSDEIVPATFADSIKSAIEDLSKKIHGALGLRHYSRSDFIIHPRRGIYALEVNTLPGLTGESLFPKSLRAIGSDTHEFAHHIIQLALA